MHQSLPDGPPSLGAKAWELAKRQHGVVTWRQLTELGLSGRAIQHRIESRRLHRIERGIYAVGRAELTQRGRWMAAVLACGPKAALSHRSAAAFWGIYSCRSAVTEVSVRHAHPRRRPGVRVYRRPNLRGSDIEVHDGISVTSPARTLVDLATQLRPEALERAVNEADRLDLIDPDTLLDALGAYRAVPGVGRLRALLSSRTFRLTDSELERRFLLLVGAAGLPMPLTRQHLNGFRVDFFWPELRLVVETDGLRYHRTPAQQAHDRLRDQAHVVAGFTPLRFTHAQVRFEAAPVQETLAAVAGRLASRRRVRAARPPLAPSPRTA